MNDGLTLDDVINICSRVSLDNGSLTFESFGTGEIRIDTLDFLYRHGLLLEDAQEIINDLKREDYFRGPTDHYDENKRNHKLWEFKKEAFGLRLYIKIIPFNKNRYIAVVSLHEDR